MGRRVRIRRHGVGRDLLKGAVAGAVATFVMGKVAGSLSEQEDREARQAVSAIHWAAGIGAGAAYAVLRRRFQGLGTTAGTALGTAFWSFLDEGLVPALGLTPGPSAFPWQTHARGRVGHLTFGTVTDGTLRLLDRVA
jgi:uncharacterized membrane protein YagU involved in acid resistance